jgi:tetratricopeptide (TPR) repeat protein
MNAEPKDTGSTPIDERHPWLGLDSFTEDTRSFFYGRDEEVAELGRRVQRKLLTVLFGQSGLGKTSILRAGLVPRLRSHGYCPIYVRIAYSADAPEPGEQIKQTILQTARHAGQWTQAGVAAAGESLWEFLHHRDDVLVNDAGQTLIPLLIFDQFEEIFTLAQTDEAGRARAARFIDDLADLVENRAPKELEAKLEADDATAERFDFARGDYRVLISLREDYLAPLESLKAKMPSITQNRLRLAPMTGKQGLEAVMGPGKGLVSQEVAEAIVRFVAGGAEIANAEVEPSLLSLVCRELNDTRLAEGRAEISLDLLAGSHDSILSNFYERALADQPASVRRIIEDELLTESGFRENVAEERLRAHFTSAGAAPETLATLVNRRLLRIEERLDVRRVELTHDVLCGVVKGSRNLRHEREAREASERMLAEQSDRAAAARRAMIRARQVATVCVVLAVGAIGAAIFAYFSTQRAKRAEDVAQQSRVQAEALLGYLTANLARELESTGRLDAIASLAKREIDYFHGLPEELKRAETQRTAAQALVQYARASRRLGNFDQAWEASSEAVTILEQQRKTGDESEATIIGLARALDVQALILNGRQDSHATAVSQRAADVIGALTKRPEASAAAREAESEVLTTLGYLQASVADPKAVATLRKALQLATELGARDVTDTYVSALYTDAGAWLTVGLLIEGRYDEARAVGEDASKVADGILAQRPGDRIALYALALMQQSLGDASVSELQPQAAIAPYLRAAVVQQTLVDFDPKNIVGQNNLASVQWSTSEAYWALGQVDDALEMLDAVRATGRIAGEGGTGSRMGQLRILSHAVMRNADAGHFDKARDIVDEIGSHIPELQKSEPKGSLAAPSAELMKLRAESRIALARGDALAARKICMDMNARLQAMQATGEADVQFKNSHIFMANDVKAQSELALKDFGAAEQSARAALTAKEHWVYDPAGDTRVKAGVSTLIALALVGQGKPAEARQVIEPVVKLHRELASRNRGDEMQKVEMAAALYAQALADPQRRSTLLRESRSLLDSLPGPVKSLVSTRTWADRVRAAIGVSVP